jgi:hypothetical protein
MYSLTFQLYPDFAFQSLVTVGDRYVYEFWSLHVFIVGIARSAFASGSPCVSPNPANTLELIRVALGLIIFLIRCLLGTYAAFKQIPYEYSPVERICVWLVLGINPTNFARARCDSVIDTGEILSIR